jgi:hypothetical protein
MSVNPPVPRCASCGATKRGHGPVVDMQPAPKRELKGEVG